MRKKSLIWTIIMLIGLSSIVCAYLFSQSLKAEADQNEDKKTKFSLSVATSKDVEVLDYSNIGINAYQDIFNTAKQAQIAQLIAAKKAAGHYKFPQILALSNPYLTNTTSVYIYFETEKVSKVSYQISAAGYPDFVGEANSSENEYETTHEFQAIGFVAGVKNTITLTVTDKEGNETTKTLTYTPPKLVSKDKNTLEVTDGTSEKALTSGLYTVFGDKNVSQRATYLVDNDGIIRGEYPILSYNSMRFVFDEQSMYYGISAEKIARINQLGQVEQVYDVGSAGYNLHHDFTLDKEGNLLALATSEEAEEKDNLVEDRIVQINTKTGKVKQIADFKALLPDLYQLATGIETITSYAGKWDPIHLNTIQYVEDGSIIVSSRETSTIMKLSNIEDALSIDYFISDESVWKGVGNYSNFVLEKESDFVSQLGQHSVTYVEDATLEEGQYYLYMFNNNSKIMDSRTNFDWSAYPDSFSDQSTDGDYSRYSKYLVDENKGTYELVDSLEVPYSAFVSSVQEMGDNLLVNPGLQGIFTEYDKNHQVIRTYQLSGDGVTSYRVYKYDFKGFYFK
ncbi:aryl-sulfate sulfotransferase [Listeria goaensis]|uniref:aryl-sulfate sulfotransferase n=1 Tax=Listeria goaensis TaxID=1649188 RepID=UPI000B58FA1C|nr:aryl-sulfate sulfotransferase [Listeria goaensis]